MASQMEERGQFGASRIEGDAAKSPIMIVLAGLPGCGKSNFCFDLFEEQDASSPWVVVCQDTLGTRKRCEDAVKEALVSGHRVVVDRCNQSVAQRKHWVDLANEHWPFKEAEKLADVTCLYFNTPYDVCVARCKARDDHPTVSSADAEKIIGCQAKEFQKPTLDEGFCSIVTMEPGDTPFYREIVRKMAQPYDARDPTLRV